MQSPTNKFDRPEQYGRQPVGPIFGGHFNENDHYQTTRPAGMNDWLLAYTLDGEGYFRTPAGEKQVGEGTLSLLRAGVPHTYGTSPGHSWNFMWVHCHRIPEFSYLPQEEVLVHTFPEGELRDRVHQAFRSMLHDSRERSSYWEQLCSNALQEIILLVARRTDRVLDPRIEQTLQRLSSHMVEPLRIDELAAAVNLSASRLSHLFKEQTGTTMIEHLNRMRIEQAALLLKHSGRNATEAALDVGFNNYNHFAELFRRHYGVSPSKYESSF
jgi:AraC-type DNA-binding domain-containing proteins